MPEVSFHTGVADKAGYTCRLLRKAWRQGRQMVVTGSDEQLQRLDALLWTFEQAEFVPHLRLRRGATPPAQMRRTPIWLADMPEDAPTRDVLVNLGPDWPEGFAGFARVIEVVGDDPADVSEGRRRWRQYRAAGAEPAAASAPASDGGA